MNMVFDEILQTKNIEKYNAIKDNKLNKHEKKWHNIILDLAENNVFLGDRFIKDYIDNIEI